MEVDLHMKYAARQRGVYLLFEKAHQINTALPQLTFGMHLTKLPKQFLRNPKSLKNNQFLVYGFSIS